jgi:ribosomal protein S18 acetylase RimI-like enzyme
MTAISGLPCWKSIAITFSSTASRCGRPNSEKGHGGALLDFADQRAAALGLAVIRLYTNVRMEKNIALYRREGYAETGTRPHPSRIGEMLVDMVRAVPRTSP